MSGYDDTRTGRDYIEEVLGSNSFADFAHFSCTEPRYERLIDAVLAVAAELRRLTEFLVPEEAEEDRS